MSQALPEISREQLSRTLREARERKGWTLEQLARELWTRGFPVSQNNLWRLENKPPRRVDTELLLWLEKVLNVELLDGRDQTQVLIEDVIAIMDSFMAGTVPPTPESEGLRRIHRCLVRPPQRDTGRMRLSSAMTAPLSGTAGASFLFSPNPVPLANIPWK